MTQLFQTLAKALDNSRNATLSPFWNPSGNENLHDDRGTGNKGRCDAQSNHGLMS